MANEQDSAGLTGPSELFMPLSSGVWSSSQYSYQDDIGTFEESNFADIYAPEDGVFLPMKDGTWVLRVITQDHMREWIGINPLNDIYSVTPEKVLGGKKIGTSKGDFKLALSITKNGAKASESVNPAQTLVYFKARFVDIKEKKEQAQASKTQAQGVTPVASAANLSNPNTKDAGPSSQLSTIQSSQGPFKGRNFTTGQTLALVAGGLLVGGTVVWLVKGR